MILYDYKQAIRDFVGKGGFVPFEHGFKSSSHAWGVSYDEISMIGGAKYKIDELTDTQAHEVLRDLLEYLNYCQLYA